jgi:pimeloyl-ACP methyl ester carboxylesterase
MVPQPETLCERPEGNIAYQVFGDGPIDLLIVPGWMSHVDLLWQEPGWVTLMDELTSFARVIRHDKIGTGLSDPRTREANLENRTGEMLTVLDAVESQRPAILGFSEGAPISVMFAATYPERLSALVLYGSYASGSVEDDGSPGRAQWIRLCQQFRESIDHWGEGLSVDWAAPSLSRNFVYRRAVGALERAAMSPSMALLTYKGNLTHFHVRDVLGSVHVPTLVVHRKDEAIPIEYAREIAAGIPSARIVELEGIDHWPTVGDIKSITGEVEEFLTGQRQEHSADRVLATVLFTDIVDSTRHAARLGDCSWARTARAPRRSHPHRNQPVPGARRTTPATVFSRDSMARRAPSGARPRSRSGCRNWASMGVVVCTPASVRSAMTK